MSEQIMNKLTNNIVFWWSTAGATYYMMWVSLRLPAKCGLTNPGAQSSM